MFGIELRIIVVYFDTGKYGKGRKRNYDLRVILERIENNDKEGLMIVGDFNGHINLLEQRKTDYNGQMVMVWMAEYNLTLLNMDERCERLYTWKRGNQKSAIDFMLVNRKMYEMFEGMTIDENRDTIDLSDHNLMSAKFDMIGCCKGEEIVIIKEGYKKDKNSLKLYKDEVEKEWIVNRPKDANQMNDSMSEIQEKVLKTTFKKKVRQDEMKIMKNNWFTNEIKDEISKRRAINRECRNCKDNIRKEILKRKYLNQKIKYIR